MKINKDYEDIIKPYLYLKTQTKGKGFRNKLIKIFNIYYRINEEQILIIQEFIDILHNSSLLIDDIEDNSNYRRGIKCAHKIFGIASTINSGNLMYFKAWEKLMELKLKNLNKFNELNKIFVNSMIKLHIGQGKEINWRNFKKCPNEEEYYEMINGKTSELFQLIIKILEFLKFEDKLEDEKEINNYNDKIIGIKIKEFCNIMGIIYQINNDLNDLIKGDKTDLKEGEFSLPIIYCIKNRGIKFNYEINKDNKDDKEINNLINIIKEFGGIEYCNYKLKEFKETGNKLIKDITELGNSNKDLKIMGCKLNEILGSIT